MGSRRLRLARQREEDGRWARGPASQYHGDLPAALQQLHLLPRRGLRLLRPPGERRRPEHLDRRHHLMGLFRTGYSGRVSPGQHGVPRDQYPADHGQHAAGATFASRFAHVLLISCDLFILFSPFALILLTFCSNFAYIGWHAVVVLGAWSGPQGVRRSIRRERRPLLLADPGLVQR